MNEYLFGATQLLLVWGLLPLAFLVTSIWALRRKSSMPVRGTGYLLIVTNVVIWTATLTTMYFGLGAMDSFVTAAAG